MKKTLYILGLLLSTFPLFGQATTGYHRVNQVLARSNSGTYALVVPFAQISVTNTATGAAATIYYDPLLSSPIPSSLVTSDLAGNYSYYMPLNTCNTESISSPGQSNIVVPNICGNPASFVTLETNGNTNGSQSLLNLVAGSGVTLVNSGGTVTISSDGGGGGGPTTLTGAVTGTGTGTVATQIAGLGSAGYVPLSDGAGNLVSSANLIGDSSGNLTGAETATFADGFRAGNTTFTPLSDTSYVIGAAYDTTNYVAASVSNVGCSTVSGAGGVYSNDLGIEGSLFFGINSTCNTGTGAESSGAASLLTASAARYLYIGNEFSGSSPNFDHVGFVNGAGDPYSIESSAQWVHQIAISGLSAGGMLKTTSPNGELDFGIPGTDYQAPISLTVSGSGAATFIGNVLNVPTPTASGLGITLANVASGTAPTGSGNYNFNGNAIVNNGTIQDIGTSAQITFTNGASSFLFSSVGIDVIGSPINIPAMNATSGANANPGGWGLQGSYWNGTAPIADNWLSTVSLGTGTNPPSTFAITHSGTPGTAKVSMPALLLTGQTGSTQCAQFDTNGNLTGSGSACGSGTVTSFSAGTLSPLFTTSVGTPTTTPALTFTLSNAAADTVLGNPTGSSAAPIFTNAPVVATLVANTSITSPLFLSGTPGYSDTGVFTQFTGSANSYLQYICQNTNSGNAASCDYIVSNDQGTATTHYGDFGINSSTFSTGTGQLGLAGATYLYSNGGDLVLGTNTSNAVHIGANNFTTDAIAISTSNIPTLTQSILQDGSGAATSCTNPMWEFQHNGTIFGCLYRNSALNVSHFNGQSGMVMWAFDNPVSVSGTLTTSGTVTSNLGTAAITSATGGTGVTSVTCATANCTVYGGTYTVVGGTATTGTIVTLLWPTTTTAWRCEVSMNGGGTGASFLGLGHSVATATGMTVSAAVTIVGNTFSFDYSCQP